MKQLKKRPWILVLALLGLLILVPNVVFAQAGSECSQSGHCVEIQDQQTGTYTVSTHITLFTIKAGQTEIDIDPADGAVFNDGCYRVEFSASETGDQLDTVTWERIGDGAECPEVSHVEIWWYQPPTAITLVSVSASSGRQQTAGILAGVVLILAVLSLGGKMWWGLWGENWWRRRQQRR